MTLEYGVNLKDSGTFRPTYEMNENATLGLEQAVRNGQTRLALEYAVRVIAELRADVDSLIQQTAGGMAPVDPEVSKEKAPSRSRAKKAEEKPPASE